MTFHFWVFREKYKARWKFLRYKKVPVPSLKGFLAGCGIMQFSGRIARIRSASFWWERYLKNERMHAVATTKIKRRKNRHENEFKQINSLFWRDFLLIFLLQYHYFVRQKIVGKIHAFLFISIVLTICIKIIILNFLYTLQRGGR